MTPQSITIEFIRTPREHVLNTERTSKTLTGDNVGYRVEEGGKVVTIWANKRVDGSSKESKLTFVLLGADQREASIDITA